MNFCHGLMIQEISILMASYDEKTWSCIFSNKLNLSYVEKTIVEFFHHTRD